MCGTFYEKLNASMDVMARAAALFLRVFLPFVCAVAVSPHVNSIVIPLRET